jgi:hypothetical protein
MNVLYCLVESRNDIDGLWETIAGLICVDLKEAQTLIDRYLENQFDICEYRVRKCTKIEYDSTPCLVRMISPNMQKVEQ